MTETRSEPVCSSPLLSFAYKDNNHGTPGVGGGNRKRRKEGGREEIYFSVKVLGSTHCVTPPKKVLPLNTSQWGLDFNR